MTVQILPAESGGLTQMQNLTRLGNATYENHVGQYVLRPNLPRHCLALVDRITDTAAVYGIFTSSGLCFLSQSLSAAFMRVCQPLPVALNASRTSGEQRKVTRILGFIAFGRPSLTSFSPSYNAAPEKNASSSSGASSGSFQVFFKSCVFAFIGFPHGDNTPHVTAWRPDQDYNAPIKFSGCYIPRFAVVFAYILSGKMFARKHLTSPRKIKAALVKRPVAFVIVEVNFHIIIVRTKNDFANCLHWLVVMAYAYPAPYKTGVGICTPCKQVATPDAESVFFVVRHMRHFMAWCVIRQRSYNRRSVALLAYHAAHDGAMCSNRCAGLAPNPLTPKSTPRRPVMVTLAGQPQGWPVPTCAGSANPVNVTALIEICTSGGDSIYMQVEAAVMVATPIQTRPEFIWLFAAVSRADLTDHTPHMVRIAAPDELTARRSLVGRYVLSFAGRIPVQGVRHV